MADDPNTPPPSSPQNPPAPPPSQTPPPTPSPPPSSGQPQYVVDANWARQVSDTITAIPEMVSKAVKEAVPKMPEPPKPRDDPGNNDGNNGDSDKGQGQKDAGGAPGKSYQGTQDSRSKLAKWWFG